MEFMIWSDPTYTWIWIVAGLVVFLSYFLIGATHMVRGREVKGRFGFWPAFWYVVYGMFIYTCGVGHVVMIYFMAVDPSALAWRFVVWVEVATAVASAIAVFRPGGYARS